MLLNFKSAFVSTGRDSDKPETINISILSGLPPMSIACFPGSEFS